MKAQGVRLVDVLLLGPFMVWAGSQGRALPRWARQVLVIAGLATVVYNGSNWLRMEREKSQGELTP